MNKKEANKLLFESTRKGDAAMLRESLSAGADVNAVDEYGRSALFFVCTHPITDWFLERDSEPVKDFDDEIEDEIRYVVIPDLDFEDDDEMEDEIHHVVVSDLDFEDDDEIDDDESERMKECANLLIKAGANINAADCMGYTPLMGAALNYYVDWCVPMLLDAGADVNAVNSREETALSLAIQGWNHEVVFLLIQAGADVNRSGYTVDDIMLRMVYPGNERIIESMLAQGADVEAVDEEGFSALRVAAMHGRLECIEVLLAHGAEVDAEDSGGQTALHYAMKAGHLSCVHRLLRAGAMKGVTSIDECLEICRQNS